MLHVRFRLLRSFGERQRRALWWSHTADIPSVRIQAIDGTRTFAPPHSQPCRLLPPSRSHLPSTILLPCRCGARILRISGFGAMATGSSMDFTPRQPQGLVHRYLPATADGPLPKLRPIGSSLPAWLWLAARFGRYHRIVELPVLGHVAVGTQAHKIPKSVTSLLASLDPVVDLHILQRAALLASPSVSLQHPLHQPPVNLLSQLDPLYLRQHLLAVSNSRPPLWPARRA